MKNWYTTPYAPLEKVNFKALLQGVAFALTVSKSFEITLAKGSLGKEKVIVIFKGRVRAGKTRILFLRIPTIIHPGTQLLFRVSTPVQCISVLSLIRFSALLTPIAKRQHTIKLITK